LAANPDTPPDEINKHLYLLSHSRLFVRLLRAITSNETFVYSDHVGGLYRSLKRDVEFFGNAIEHEYEADAALGIRYYSEEALPDVLSEELVSPDALQKLTLTIDGLEGCVDELEDAVGHLAVDPSPFYDRIVRYLTGHRSEASETYTHISLSDINPFSLIEAVVGKAYLAENMGRTPNN